MTFQEKPLFQAQPAGTTAVAVYTPAAGVIGTIKSINIANASTAAAVFSLYHDIDGLIFNSSSVLFPDISIDPSDTFTIDQWIAINSTASGIGFKTDTANSLTITGYGAEFST